MFSRLAGPGRQQTKGSWNPRRPRNECFLGNRRSLVDRLCAQGSGESMLLPRSASALHARSSGSPVARALAQWISKAVISACRRRRFRESRGRVALEELNLNVAAQMGFRIMQTKVRKAFRLPALSSVANATLAPAETTTSTQWNSLKASRYICGGRSRRTTRERPRDMAGEG